MTTYRVSSVRGDGSAPAGGTWATAAVKLASVQVYLVEGDIVLVDSEHVDLQLVGSTLALPKVVVCSVNATTELPEFGAKVGIGAANVGLQVYGHGSLYFIDFCGPTSTGGSAAIAFGSNNTHPSCLMLYGCRLFWRNGTSGAGPSFGPIGNVSSNDESRITLIDCVFKAHVAGNRMVTYNSHLELINFSVEAGSLGTPTALFRCIANTRPTVVMRGGDLSVMPSCGLVEFFDVGGTYDLFGVKLPETFTPYAFAPDSGGTPIVRWIDCASGDTHNTFGYQDGLGSVVSDTGITFSSGDPSAGMSWKITTTALANNSTPFVSPWIDRWQAPAGPITPRIEILRNDSDTAFTDAEVWGEFMAKVTDGSVQSSLFADRRSLPDLLTGTPGSPQAAGEGLSAWTGEGGTAWSGKVDAGTAVTVAEEGYLSGRVCVSLPNTSLYIDPAIRT